MSNLRLSANARALHDDGRCGELCPACAQIDTAQYERDFAAGDRDYLINNLPEGWREP